MKRARDDPKPKIGAGSGEAMLRLGLKELASAIVPESHIVQPTEMGGFGTLTQGEIAEAKLGSPERETEDGRESVLAGELRQAESRDVHGKDSRDFERG